MSFAYDQFGNLVSVGADEIDDLFSGYDVSGGVAVGYSNAEMIGFDEFGAPVRRPMPTRGRPRVPAALVKDARVMEMAREVDPNAVFVQNQVDTRRRYIDLGIPSTVIPANSSALITVRTQRVFRVEEVIVPDGIASALVLIAASVGQNSQLAGGAPVPMDVFSSKSFRPKGVLWDTANPGIDIQLNIGNTTGAPVTFIGDLRGTATVR